MDNCLYRDSKKKGKGKGKEKERTTPQGQPGASETWSRSEYSMSMADETVSGDAATIDQLPEEVGPSQLLDVSFLSLIDLPRNRFSSASLAFSMPSIVFVSDVSATIGIASFKMRVSSLLP